jgi:outer membrane receptor protein involved in Fe transport
VSALIAGTGLEAISDDNGGLIVRKPQPKNARAASKAGAESPEEVIVTGTHIQGEGPVGSLVTNYTRVDLDQSGSATLEQFARQMPENLSNTDPLTNFGSYANLAAHPGGDANNTSGAAFNLNGLGVESTLTLVNGHRMAYGGDLGSFVDVSMIPFSAIDHIEVLDDGASSIYGSDAVSGVVNIIMRKDYDGAESSLRFGGATDGGADEFTASQLVGKSWSTGSVLINYEYDNQTKLDAAQRSYIPAQGGPDDLLPSSMRSSVYFYGSQEIDPDTTISGEAYYSHRNTDIESTIQGTVEYAFTTEPSQMTNSGGTVTVDRKLWGDWTASVVGNYSSFDQTFQQTETASLFGFTESAFESSHITSNLWSADALVNGTVWTLPGGDIKTAIGGTYRAENFQDDSIEVIGGQTVPYLNPNYSRHVESGFGEVYIPIIGDANALPFLRRLEISGAVRYDDYSDVGSSTNPKVGVSVSPFDDLKFRGTWGTSYRAPLLTELHQSQSYQAEPIPDPSAPGGSENTLLEGGGNPDLRAETANVYSAGADWHPHWVENLTLSATYSHVDYKDLIGIPPVTNFGQIFTDPELAPFVNTHPNPAVVAAAFKSPGFGANYTGQGPSGIQAIFDEEYANLAAESEGNIALRAAYNFTTDFGQFSFNGAAIDYVSYQLKSAPTAPNDSIVGTFGEPPRFKGRFGSSWSDDGFTATLTFNYSSSYNNSLAPGYKIASWTTADLYLGYNLGPDKGAGLLQNIRFGLTMQNIMDQRPPYVYFPPSELQAGQPPVPFDPVNASPLGRVIAIQVTKDF